MLIRHAEPSRDGPGCLAIYGPFADETAVSFEDRAPTLAEFEHRIDRIGRTHAFLVAEEAGQVAGFAHAGPHRDRGSYRWSAEVSVYLHAAHRGRGLGRALYEPLFALLEEQGFRLLIAGITIPNPASVALHNGLGFVDVGVFPQVGWKAGGWRDVLWLARPLGPQASEDRQPPSPGAPARLARPIQL